MRRRNVGVSVQGDGHFFAALSQSVEKLEGNGPVESAGNRALKINAGLLVGVGDISLTAVDQVSNLRRPLSPIPFCSWGISFFSRRSFVICG